MWWSLRSAAPLLSTPADLGGLEASTFGAVALQHLRPIIVCFAPNSQIKMSGPAKASGVSIDLITRPVGASCPNVILMMSQ